MADKSVNAGGCSVVVEVALLPHSLHAVVVEAAARGLAGAAVHGCAWEDFAYVLHDEGAAGNELLKSRF